MSIQEMADKIAETQKMLATQDYGRKSDHTFGPCDVCRMHVCLTHHSHTTAGLEGN